MYHPINGNLPPPLNRSSVIPKYNFLDPNFAIPGNYHFPEIVFSSKAAFQKLQILAFPEIAFSSKTAFQKLQILTFPEIAKDRFSKKIRLRRAKQEQIYTVFPL